MIQLLAAFGLGDARGGRLEVVGDLARPRQLAGVVLGQRDTRGRNARAARPAAPAASRNRRDAARRRRSTRRQVRLGKVAVVVRFLLAAHGDGALRALVPQPRLLHDAPAVLDDVDLPRDLVLERLLQVAEGVEVLDLGLRAERRRAGRAHRHVRVAAQAALFHVAVVHAEPDQQVAQVLEEQRPLRPAERRSGSVTISMSGTPARL